MNPTYDFVFFLKKTTKKGEMLLENFVDFLTYMSLWTRFSGTVVGTEDANPIRWPGSKWRCLKVQFMVHKPVQIHDVYMQNLVFFAGSMG